MQAGGWQLLAHPLFQDQLQRLKRQVTELATRDPKNFSSHPAAKFLATVQRHILIDIPRDPNSPEFRQGNALGPDNRHWFRAKFHQRYRLFFRFSSKHKIIVYAWINDESSLRKAGSKNDPYARFKAMLDGGDPPNSFDDLARRSRPLA
jgi:toxin YhaV